jgi:hypothetical protein
MSDRITGDLVGPWSCEFRAVAGKPGPGKRLIEAIIFGGHPRTAATPPGLRTAPLQVGLTMLPVTSDVPAAVDPAAVGDEQIPAGWMLRKPVARILAQRLAGRTILRARRTQRSAVRPVPLRPT